MYPAMKQMNAVHSGTGVFYQAMPAVGADGKNIMKLIPVQVVNGQFVQTPVNKPKAATPPQKPVSIDITPTAVQVVKNAALNFSNTQQGVRKQVSLVDALPNRMGLDLCNSLNKHPLQQQTVNLMAKVVPQVAAPATTSEKSVRVSSQLPVTVKSPALPSGQYLQIPPNAQVRTVPASELPPGIKKQIFTSSACPSPGSGSPSVVYVSPITTVNPEVTPPSDSAFHSLLSETSNKACCEPPSKGAKKHLKLIPKVSQRPNSPLKWMIEEEDTSTAPTFDPLNSPLITSEILLTVAERENASKHRDIITEPVSELIQSKSGQGQENALVMCNGKVFFVAKKHSLPAVTRRDDSPAAAASRSSATNKTIVSSTQRAKQDVRIIISDESDEVIDLCDDDDVQDDSSQQVTHLDEDNVIFVSYIPPKSASGPAQDLGLKTQTALGTESDQMDTSSSISVTRRKSPDATTGGDSKDESRTVGDHPHVFDSAVTILHKDLNISSQQSPSTQQLENMDADTDSPADPDSSSGICSQTEEGVHRMESSMNSATSQTSSLAPESHQMTDHLLREMFKITADVKICLQRIDEVSAASVHAKHLQSQSIQSVEDHQTLMNGLENKPYSSQVSDCDDDPVNVKGIKELTGQKLPHTHIGPLKCSNFKQNKNGLCASKCNSGQSLLKGTTCNAEPVIDYVEPIDEDFLSADENDIPNSQDTDVRPQTASCVDLNANTRRMGRTRKRTICPCCIPGTQAPAVKSSAKSVEPDAWVWTTEKTSKNSGRTKAVRKEVKTSKHLSCLIARNKQKCPASESLSSTSMDSDELKQHEQIKRLKELLRQKEAALELMS